LPRYYTVTWVDEKGVTHKTSTTDPQRLHGKVQAKRGTSSGVVQVDYGDARGISDTKSYKGPVYKYEPEPLPPQPSLQEVVGPPKPEPITVSPKPIATFTQETGKPLWKAFPTEKPSVPESKIKEYHARQYSVFPIVPGPIRKQINVPSEVKQAGASREYQRVAYEQYLGVKGGGGKQLEHKLLSSEWYTHTQPIWMVEGKEKPVAFWELKKEEPALYLYQKKGLWTPTIDVVRWRKEQEQLLGAGSSTALAVSEVPLTMFDFDYYFSEDREKYRAERLYQTMKGVKAGRTLESWAGVQVPAYTEFVIPAATGYGLGKIFTGVKLAGGVKQASRLLKIGYGAGVAGMGAGVGVTGYQVVSGGFGAKELAKMSFQGLVGGVSFYGGRASALTSFKSKYPNLEWRYTKRIVSYDKSGRLIVKSEPGVEPVTGKQYVKFKEMMISGEGEPVHESGMYQYSQMFKPGGKPELYINFPGNRIQPSRGSIDIGFIKEPGVRKAFGVVDVAGKPYKTIFGERAWSTKGFLGTVKKDYIPGSFETVDVFYRTGGVNVIKQGIYRNIIKDVEAAQSVLLGGLRTIEPVSVASFVKPTIGYMPSGLGMGLITPSFEFGGYDTRLKIKPEITFKYESRFKYPIFKYEPSRRIGYVPVSVFKQSKIQGFGYKQSLRTGYAPIVSDIELQDVASGMAPIPTQIQNYQFKMPKYTPKVSSLFPLYPNLMSGYGGWAMGYFDKVMRTGYRYRKHKVPRLKDLIGG